MSAEVLHPPGHTNGQHFYQSSASIKPSSNSSLLDRTSRNQTPTPHAEHQEWLPAMPLPSTCQSVISPEVVTATSGASRRAAEGEGRGRTLTLETDLGFPEYDVARFGATDEGTATPPFHPFGDDAEDAPTGSSTTSDTTRSDSPLPTPTVADDTAVKEHPSRQVDFLSHDWREEDIWSSWRHIVSQRRSYGEKSRLENASWRTWAKSKYRLSTVSPETLNWMKESDVTWLYGPLKPASSYPITHDVSEPSSQLSRSNSFIAKKPILKKRSMSEIMLQRSISSSSLVRQAAASVQAQGRTGRILEPSSDYSETPSRDQMDYFTYQSASSSSTPCEAQEKRHIRFDDRVEQCIAVDIKDSGAEFGEDSDAEEEEEEQRAGRGSDSDSDDGIMIKTAVRHTRKRRVSSKGSRSNSIQGRKTIETLPSTTLKYRTDSPDITAEAQHHTFGGSWAPAKLSPSPSQETLRPTRPSNNFLLTDEDEDENEEGDSDSSWSFGASNPKSSLGASAGVSSRRDRASGSSKARRPTHGSDYEIEGMRRTGSGMFMPYDEEEEDDAMAQGLFGRVSETINTARDIAHVIWNVGWRK